MTVQRNRMGVISMGIETPLIKRGDDLPKTVLDSVGEALGEDGLSDGDIICITEAVVAIAQNNFVTEEEIKSDISRLFGEELALVDPIQSRNRFLNILKAIAATPTLKKIKIFLTYPADEVGNHLISEEQFYESGISTAGIMTATDFIQRFGTPRHPFTGMDYISLYKEACQGKAEIFLCNDFSKIPSFCKDALVCSIHRRKIVKKILIKNGAQKVYDLSDIAKEPINGSGYNEEYGLYGSNMMDEGLKLMPRECQTFVEKLQESFLERYGKKVEVMVFGDGAFKDPVGGIWELADPVTTLGATKGLKGTPKEVKLKYLADQYRDKTSEEIDQIIKEERRKRQAADDISNDCSLGTTPRQITDLLASLSDLTTGSGDRQTPVVVISGYLR